MVGSRMDAFSVPRAGGAAKGTRVCSGLGTHSGVRNGGVEAAFPGEPSVEV